MPRNERWSACADSIRAGTYGEGRQEQPKSGYTRARLRALQKEDRKQGWQSVVIMACSRSSSIAPPSDLTLPHPPSRASTPHSSPFDHIQYSSYSSPPRTAFARASYRTGRSRHHSTHLLKVSAVPPQTAPSSVWRSAARHSLFYDWRRHRSTTKPRRGAAGVPFVA